MIGFIIDPMNPERTNDDIVKHLCEHCGSLEEFFRGIQVLSGRYVMICKTGSDFVVVGDACSLRQIFFRFEGDSMVLTSSPRMFIDYFDYTPQISQAKREFVELPEYKRRLAAWYGDKSIDDRLCKLLPNHYLDLSKREVRRIPPPSRGASDEQAIVDNASSILTGTYSALVRRYQLLQPLTAGWDTRVLLAASRSVKDSVRFYVFDRQSASHSADVWVPTNLSKRLGLDFRAAKPPSMSEELLAKYNSEHIMPSFGPMMGHIQYHYEHSRADNMINVNGNGAEIARCFYGYTKREVSLEMLLTFSGYAHRSAFVEEELARWLPDAKQYAQTAQIPLLDLFYWEQRMGNWGALYPFQQDIAIEEVSPFNNRALLFSLLGVRPERRRYPRYHIFRKLMEHLWPDVLSEPINPSENHIKMLIMKRNSIVRYAASKGIAFVRSVLK